MNPSWVFKFSLTDELMNSDEIQLVLPQNTFPWQFFVALRNDYMTSN